MDPIIEGLITLLQRNQGFLRVQLEDKSEKAIYFSGRNTARKSFDVKVEIEDTSMIEYWPVSIKPKGESVWIYSM